MRGAGSRLGAVSERLREAGCVSHDDESRELCDRAPDEVTLERWIRRREAGEPLAWITGIVVFGGVEVAIEPGVYVPRLHTEELARRAAALVHEGGRAIDLCTGSGAIAAYLLSDAPACEVIGIDLDPTAAACARGNGVDPIVGNLGDPLRARSADLITVVPPYVPTDSVHLLASDVQRFEPRLALDGGPDGLRIARRAVASASRVLKEGGWLLMEIADQQDRALTPTLELHGFEIDDVWEDEDGDPRGVAARLRPSVRGADPPRSRPKRSNPSGSRR
jgi:release factor glutamine methyltransferase